MSELKPCPFCGETKSFGLGKYNERWRVVCNNCDAEGPNYNETKQQAIDAWNKRGTDLSEIKCPDCWNRIYLDANRIRRETVQRCIEILLMRLVDRNEKTYIAYGAIDEIKKEFNLPEKPDSLNNSTNHNHELCSTEKSKTETSD